VRVLHRADRGYGSLVRGVVRYGRGRVRRAHRALRVLQLPHRSKTVATYQHYYAYLFVEQCQLINDQVGTNPSISSTPLT
jgi:hypothetical protein